MSTTTEHTTGHITGRTTGHRVRALNPSTWSQAFGYDQAQVRDLGGLRLLTVAAQGPLDDTGRLLHAGDLAAQLALALAHVGDLLEQAGLAWTDLVQLRVYSTDLPSLLDEYDVAVDHLTARGARPPATFVEVAGLPVPGMAVALEAVALG